MLLLYTAAVVFAIITAQRNDYGGVYAFLSTTPSCVKIRSASTNILRGFDDVWWAISGIGDDDSTTPDNDDIVSRSTIKSSHIVYIKSSNIAGMINEGDDSDIKVDFGQEAGTSLIAITGESGTGKSLLVSKAIDLVTGGKAISSLVPRAGESNNDEESSSFVELTANLYEPQLSTISTSLQQYGIDPSVLYSNNSNNNSEQSNKVGHLHLKRTLTTTENGRLKSECEINGQHIPLKTMRQISAPLLVRVDVAIASGALARPASRLSILDMGVEDSFKQNCIKCRDEYKEAKKNRERIKHELESRVLPSSLQGMSNSNTGFDEEQMELMQHWLEELDSFETRINTFQQAVSTQYNEMLSEGESNDKSSGIGKALHNLQKTTWRGDTESNDDDDDHSLIAYLLDFREGMKTVESQLVSTHEAYESLASLTAPNSALVSLENTRKLLFSISNEDSGPLFETIEKTHELLNTIEESLNNCARSIDGSSNSLMSTLEKMQFPISIEEVDGIIADWNALARKHGISPYSLPNCQQTIREELGGNVEALKLLPAAEESERIALEEYSNACRELSDARREVATELSSSVSSVLPSLGLEGSTLNIDLGLRSGGFDDPYHGTETIGVDIADFLLLHEKTTNGVSNRGGSLDQVGSSGEKSRILLAIETALPGSIGSTCNSFINSAESLTSQSDFRTPPISIVYDEIDAHVGGRAAVTMAKLLAEQSRFRRRGPSDDESLSNRGSQIIAITHSASLAAIADRHIVVERGNNGSKGIRTYALDETNRSQEIARMASGDLASGEAKTFADALIRDAQKELNL